MHGYPPDVFLAFSKTSCEDLPFKYGKLLYQERLTRHFAIEVVKKYSQACLLEAVKIGTSLLAGKEEKALCSSLAVTWYKNNLLESKLFTWTSKPKTI